MAWEQLKQQGPTERSGWQASIAAYLMHTDLTDLNDLRDHAAERACGITESLLDRAEWAPTSRTCPTSSPAPPDGDLTSGGDHGADAVAKVVDGAAGLAQTRGRFSELRQRRSG